MEQGLCTKIVAGLKGGRSVGFDAGEPVVGLGALTPKISRRPGDERWRIRAHIVCQRVIEHSRDGSEFCPDKTLQPREDRHVDTGLRHLSGPVVAGV